MCVIVYSFTMFYLLLELCSVCLDTVIFPDVSMKKCCQYAIACLSSLEAVLQ